MSVGFICPVCGARWVVRSLEHKCWKDGHISDHYECIVCVRDARHKEAS